ncbi:hypothetical protein TNCV_4190551 [Trichonephila clavipes]|nr:hypothetical protein TNCV_4190551 [Trichonephila clavipes]
MHTRCLKCGKPHRTNDFPIKEKIANPICINCNKPGHMANWSQCEEFPKIKKKQGESALNHNTESKTRINKISKPVTTDLSFATALAGAEKENKQPRNLTPTEEAPQINDEKSNDKSFGFKDAIVELRKFFLDYSFLMEMGRQFSDAKGDERIDIFYQHLVNSYDQKT